MKTGPPIFLALMKTGSFYDFTTPFTTCWMASRMSWAGFLAFASFGHIRRVFTGLDNGIATIKRMKHMPFTMTTVGGMNWNEFRKHHKGEGKDRMSELWKLYKEGEYDPEASTNIDPNHGHDLDYIAEVEAEMAEEAEENEVKREPEQQEYLNELNNEEKRTGLKSITHW